MSKYAPIMAAIVYNQSIHTFLLLLLPQQTSKLK